MSAGMLSLYLQLLLLILAPVVTVALLILAGAYVQHAVWRRRARRRIGWYS